MSGPKEPRDSAQFTTALAIILHLFYLLEKVECRPDQEDMKHQSYCSSVPVIARMSSLLHMVVDTDHKRGSLLSGHIPLYPGGQGALDCRADLDSRNFDNTTPSAHRKAEQLPGIMNALIEAGTHMDTTTTFKKTAYELLHEKLLAKSTTQPFSFVTL